MDHFENTAYDETPYYDRGETDNVNSDLEHWTMQLERFNNEHSDILPADWLDSNNTMSTYPGHSQDIQEVDPLGNGTRTVSPEAIARASKTLSALPHVQTYHTALDTQSQSQPYNMDPHVIGNSSLYKITSEPYLKSRSSRLSFEQTPQSSSFSEEVRILKKEVERLQRELFHTQQALQTEYEARCRLETAAGGINNTGHKLKVVEPPKEGENKSARTTNIERFRAEDYYEPIPHVPEDWVGPITGRAFTYTAEGELDPEAKFSPIELEDFLVNHPQNHPLVGSRPVCWIGNVPADASNRYPTKESAACRFEGCSITNHTIKKGSYRITIDEWGFNANQINKDPYHNAGYLHLFCFEKFMDLPGLYRQGVTIMADTREFNEGRNKMAITRDYPTMKGIVDEYLQTAPSLGDYRAEGPDGWYRDSLSLQLTEEHLRRQPATRQAVRGSRGGNSIDVHKNNLDEMNKNQKSRRPYQPRKPDAPKRKYTKRATTKGTKRKRADRFEDDSDDDDEFEINSNILDPTSDTQPRETRAAKRQKSAELPSWEMNGANGALDKTFKGRAVRDWMGK